MLLEIAQEAGVIGLQVAILGGAAACMTICALKGKWFFSITSLPLIATGIPIVGAVRPARGGSWWARHRSGAAVPPAEFALTSRRQVWLEIAGAAVLWLLVLAGSGAVE